MLFGDNIGVVSAVICPFNKSWWHERNTFNVGIRIRA